MMTQLQYQLETGSTKHPCPSCRQKRFHFYLDQTGAVISPEYGRCDRENSCGYHQRPPKENAPNGLKTGLSGASKAGRAVTADPKPVSYHDPELVRKSMTRYEKNSFVVWLRGLFGDGLTDTLIQRFRIGTSLAWPPETGGAVCFWQIDESGRVHGGKLIDYDAEGHRRHVHAYGKEFPAYWVHTILKSKGKLSQDEFVLNQALFGLHQISTESKPIAVAEAEKTAIVASVYFDQFTWLAAGTLDGLQLAKFAPLAGKSITFFPDLSIDGKAFAKWTARAAEIQRTYGCRVKVVNILEKIADTSARQRGLDLADYLIERNPGFTWALKDGYPAFWDHNEEVKM